MKTTIAQSRIDWKQYEAWKSEGGTDKAFAESVGMDGNNFAQYKRRHLRTKPTPTSERNSLTSERNPSIVDVPVETVSMVPVNGAPEYTSALAVHQSTPAWQDHETRLQVLEAFIATLQTEQRSSAPLSVPECTSVPVHFSVPAERTWKKTGATLAADMLDAIDSYATQHRLEKREVLDVALRTFFAQVAEAVRDA